MIREAAENSKKKDGIELSGSKEQEEKTFAPSFEKKWQIKCAKMAERQILQATKMEDPRSSQYREVSPASDGRRGLA